jgi:hypothetical protein
VTLHSLSLCATWAPKILTSAFNPCFSVFVSPWSVDVNRTFNNNFLDNLAVIKLKYRVASLKFNKFNIE